MVNQKLVKHSFTERSHRENFGVHLASNRKSLSCHPDLVCWKMFGLHFQENNNLQLRLAKENFKYV